MTVERMRAEMSNLEFQRWRAYYRVVEEMRKANS